MLEQIAATLENSIKIDGNLSVTELPRRAPVQLDGQFRELDLDFDANTGVFWCRFQFSNRPSFTPEVLSELRRMRQLLASRQGAAGSQEPQVKYMVLGSRMPGIFNLGGDLHLFADLIRKRDRAALTAYARACVAEVHANSMALDLPIITMSLVQGDAPFDPAAPRFLPKQNFACLMVNARLALVASAYDGRSGQLSLFVPGAAPLLADTRSPEGRASIAALLSRYMADEARGNP